MLPYDRIVSRCEETGITKAFLNKLIGGYRGKLTELGNGKTTLTELELSKIANALRTSTDYLLGKTDDPTPPGEKEKPPAQGEGLSEVKKELIQKILDRPDSDAEFLLQYIERMK